MEKKGLAFLIALLVIIPGCWGRKKTADLKSKKTALRAPVFSSIHLPVADRDEGEEVQSFFDDEFVTFAGDDEFDLEAADSGRTYDEFSWIHDAGKDELEVSYFDFNKDDIRQDEREKAKRNAQKIKRILDEEGSDAKVIVNGHTCQYGARTPNIVLSERRARNYADFLKANGIPEDRIGVVGRGKELLVVKDGPKEEWWPNRRVELHIEHPGAAPAA